MDIFVENKKNTFLFLFHTDIITTMDLSTNKTTCMLYVNFNCLYPANVGYVVT